MPSQLLIKPDIKTINNDLNYFLVPNLKKIFIRLKHFAITFVIIFDTQYNFINLLEFN